MGDGIELNAARTVAVDRHYFWKPINDETPKGVKLQLINKRGGGIAVYGVLDSTNRFHFDHWAPLPVFDKT